MNEIHCAMKPKRLGLILLLTVATVGVLLVYGFRREEIIGATDGELFLKYRWGKRAEAHYDVNRDGTIDSRRILDPNAGHFDAGVFVESFESAYCNGVFDIHILFQDGTVQLIEYDSDSDGRFDLSFSGSEAEAIYKKWPDNCQGLFERDEGFR